LNGLKGGTKQKSGIIFPLHVRPL